MKLSFVFTISLIISIGLSQRISAQSTKVYIITSDEPVDYMYKANNDLMRSALQAADDRITENKKKREALIDWIYELKQKTNDTAFLDAMAKFYNQLSSMNPDDDPAGFSRKGSELDKIKLSIKEEIDNYNSRIKEEKTRNQPRFSY